MSNTQLEPIPEGKRFPADPTRIVLFGLFACSVYGSGIGMVVYAAYLTNKAVHAGNGMPIGPWLAALILVVSGMLSVIYGFFFRPRELRLTENQVAKVYWDGNGKVLDRKQVESVEAAPTRIVLRSAGKRFVVDRMFSKWPQLRGELGAWTPQNRAQGAKAE